MIGTKRVGLLLVVGLLAGAIAIPSAASAGPVASAAKKKCKHKQRGAKAKHKKCRRKKGGSAPPAPNTPSANTAALGISPASFNFGSFPLGLASGSQQFTVTNSSSGASGPLSTSVTGANAGNYSKSGDTCAGFSLAGGSSCYLYLTCVGSGVLPATFNADLVVSANPGGTREAALTCQQI